MTGATISYHLNILKKAGLIFVTEGEELYLLHAEHFCRRGSNAVAFGIEGRFF